jgi:hypothetical protein
MLFFVTELGILTVRNTKKGAAQNVGGLPLPSTYLAAAVVYGIAGEIAKGGGARGVTGTVIAAAVTLATYMNYIDPATLTVGKSKTTAATPATSTGAKS